LCGLLVPVYKCPSSPTDPFVNEPSSSNENRSMMHEYVGIAGAYSDPANREGTCKDSIRGKVCNTGLLLANEVRMLRDALDGTSNTIIVAEQSGTVNKVPIRSNYGGGWCGAAADDGLPVYSVTTLPSSPPINFYHTALTVVQWQLNYQTPMPNSSSKTYETNTILNSFHPGIVEVLLADGSVRGLADTVDMNTVRRLCTANDGLPVAPY